MEMPKQLWQILQNPCFFRDLPDAGCRGATTFMAWLAWCWMSLIRLLSTLLLRCFLSPQNFWPLARKLQCFAFVLTCNVLSTNKKLLCIAISLIWLFKRFFWKGHVWAVEHWQVGAKKVKQQMTQTSFCLCAARVVFYAGARAQTIRLEKPFCLFISNLKQLGLLIWCLLFDMLTK